jgi:hypothetical protein
MKMSAQKSNTKSPDLFHTVWQSEDKVVSIEAKLNKNEVRIVDRERKPSESEWIAKKADLQWIRADCCFEWESMTPHFTTETDFRAYYFTYGHDQFTADGMELVGFFTIIYARTYADARALMWGIRGKKFSRQYSSREAAGVDRHGLIHISPTRVALSN